jgi:hypothetical protein
MIIKTYFSKSNTIVKNSNINYGLNPITTLFYGHTGYSRYMFHFTLDYIKEMLTNKMFPDIFKLKHILKIFNSGAIDFNYMFDPCWTLENKEADRAVSFDLVLFKIPQSWDEGKGYDNLVNTHFTFDEFQSCEGSNWFHRKSLVQWGGGTLGSHSHRYKDPYAGIVNGIYCNKYLQDQYRMYQNGQESIILRHQHFDMGSENIELDITNIVNNAILCEGGTPNYGYCIAFDPFLEPKRTNPIQSVNFFTEKTSTWFEPYVETSYDEDIHDNRQDMFLDVPRRLYFYNNIGGVPTNLNKLPTVKITGNYENGNEIEIIPEVQQSTMGVYYADVIIPSIDEDGNELVPNRMLFDTWSNLEYYNEKFDKVIKVKDQVLEFTTKDSDEFNLPGDGDFLPKQYAPIIHGIHYDEKIHREEGFRKVYVECSIPYTVQQSELVDNLYYMIYVKEADKIINCFSDWQPVNKTFNTNYFIFDSRTFLPRIYYIDVITKSNMETKRHSNLVKFEIVNIDKDGHYN